MEGLFRETGIGNFPTAKHTKGSPPPSCPHFNKCGYENRNHSSLFLLFIGVRWWFQKQ